MTRKAIMANLRSSPDMNNNFFLSNSLHFTRSFNLKNIDSKYKNYKYYGKWDPVIDEPAYKQSHDHKRKRQGKRKLNSNPFDLIFLKKISFLKPVIDFSV